MMHIKLLLTLMTTSLGSALYGMEKEQSSLSELPLEVRQHIASLLLEKTRGYKYDLLKKIPIGNCFLLAFSSDENDLLITDMLTNEKSVYLCTIKTGKQEPFYEFEAGTSVKTVNPDKNTMVIDIGHEKAILYDAAANLALKEHIYGAYSIFSSSEVAFSPDEKTVIEVEPEGNIVYLYDIESKELLKEFKHPSRVYIIEFSSNGKTILTGSADSTARLWDVESSHLLKEFKGHTDSIHSVAFSPDVKTVFTGSYDKTARLWDVTTGIQLKEFKDHNDHINSGVFSKDGEMIAIGSQDGTVIIYKRSKESHKETFERKGQAAEKEYQEKLKLLLNP